MKLFAKTEYACIAVLELALRHGSGQPVRIREIAETHGIPARFLVQILLQLKGGRHRRQYPAAPAAVIN
jgi:DNA-binding IscR family transcriptional regulator